MRGAVVILVILESIYIGGIALLTMKGVVILVILESIYIRPILQKILRFVVILVILESIYILKHIIKMAKDSCNPCYFGKHLHLIE